MAFKMTANAQITFYSSLFGESSLVVDRVKSLVAHGAVFETGMYTLKCTFTPAGKASFVYQMNLTIGSTALMKGSVPIVITELNKAMIDKWITAVYAESVLPTDGFKGEPDPEPSPLKDSFYHLHLHGIYQQKLDKPDYSKGLIPVIKVIREITSLSLQSAKALADSATKGTSCEVKIYSSKTEALIDYGRFKKAGGLCTLFTDSGNMVPMPDIPADNIGEKENAVNVAVEYVAGPMPAKPQKMSNVIALCDAEALGQKVHGTTDGSVYYAIALNPRVKVASRIYKAGTVSIRVEYKNPLEEEIVKMQEAGLQLKAGAYASMHFGSDGVPPARIVGAFLMGLGIPFDQQVTNASELVVE